MLHIQKYKAKIKGTETEVIGYIIEAREELGQEVITALLKLTRKV